MVIILEMLVNICGDWNVCAVKVVNKSNRNA